MKKTITMMALLATVMAAATFTWAFGGQGGGEGFDGQASTSGSSANVENDVYGAGWNGDTTNAPSQNAVYDKIETISSGHTDGADCDALSYPLGVDADGAVVNCTDASTEIDSIVATHDAIADAHHAATADTNANTECAGGTTYLDGEGNCDDISSVYGDMFKATYDADSNDMVDASEAVHMYARKGSVGTITEGSPVYVSGYNVGGWYEVEVADADDAAKMPCVGVAAGDLTNAASGMVIMSGEFHDTDTSGGGESWVVGQELYVSDAGALTDIKPSNVDDAVQKVAQVLRVHAVNGTLTVFGAGRSNDIPPLQDAYFWVGNGSNVGTAVQMGTDATMSNTGALALATDSVAMNEVDADGNFTALTGNWRTTGTLSGGVVTKSTAANYAIGDTNVGEMYGGVVYVTSAATITIPAVAAGESFTVITIGAIAVHVDPNASDKMYLDGTLLDDGDKASNTSTAGDAIVCTYYSADGWYCMSGSPDGDLWTDGS
jgi:hypothetical protein